MSYKFTHNDVEYTLPDFKVIPAGLVRKIRKLEETDGLFTLIETVASPEALAALDEMTLVEFGQVVAKWQEEAGVGLGESKK